MKSAVVINHLSVSLSNQVQALDEINLELPAGRTVGLIGPSGAGKTTLMRCIVGRQRPSSGRLQILGQPAGSPSLRHGVSYMTQALSVYADLTVAENLSYFLAMAGQPRRRRRTMIDELLATVDLADKRNSLVNNLSGGQKQRVSLAVALIGTPKLMVLDEPTVGLDPVLREHLWKLFAHLARNGTSLVISSHSMDEAERCDDLVLLRNGQVLAHTTPAALRHETNSPTVEASFLKLVKEQQ